MKPFKAKFKGTCGKCGRFYPLDAMVVRLDKPAKVWISPERYAPAASFKAITVRYAHERCPVDEVVSERIPNNPRSSE